ncbi:MAG: hypothetical protein JWQ95_3200 [Sphaerisporangium sp.]|nr:hypothetical protein [Sphaerisporangium sp.]
MGPGGECETVTLPRRVHGLFLGAQIAGDFPEMANPPPPMWVLHVGGSGRALIVDGL